MWLSLTQTKGKKAVRPYLFAAAAAIALGGCAGHGSKKTENASVSIKAETSVLIDGVRFDVLAEPMPVESGWSLSVTVKIAVDDGLEHWIEKNPIYYEGSYTTDDGEKGFGMGAPMEIPPQRVSIKPGAQMVFSAVLPPQAEKARVDGGGSMKLTVKVSGMVSTDGTIIKPAVARVTMDVSEDGIPSLAVEAAASSPAE